MRNLIRQSVNKMKGYVPGEQPVGTRIVKLNTNENPYPPSSVVLRAFSKMDINRISRYPDPLSTKLSERIAELHGCDRSCVFVGNGLDEILALCTRAFVENDGSIGYFEPSYSLYPVLADIREVDRKPVKLNKNFEWRMPADYRSSLFFLTNPNAPSGILYDKKTVREFCTEFPGVVFIDEAYVDFAREDCADIALELDNVLIGRSLSKSYSLAGVRIGYAVGSAKLIESLFKIKDSYNIDVISQELALAALSDVYHMKGNVARIRATRQNLVNALKELEFTVYPSEANFVWTKPSGIDAEKLFRELKEQRIFIRHFPGRPTNDFVRISIGTDHEIKVLLTAIRRIIGKVGS